MLDEVAAEPRKVTHTTMCIAGRLVAALPAPDRDDLVRALGNPEYTTAAIRRVLNRRGVDVKQEALSRHRHGRCCCEPRG